MGVRSSCDIFAINIRLASLSRLYSSRSVRSVMKQLRKSLRSLRTYNRINEKNISKIPVSEHLPQPQVDRERGVVESVSHDLLLKHAPAGIWHI